ncbi:hypothetical protein HPB50_029253 [Hyalomma asiaticum]|nr:hypothetical protein HPB50_029253 [Hyalomma asiaticum]
MSYQLANPGTSVGFTPITLANTRTLLLAPSILPMTLDAPTTTLTVRRTFSRKIRRRPDHVPLRHLLLRATTHYLAALWRTLIGAGPPARDVETRHRGLWAEYETKRTVLGDIPATASPVDKVSAPAVRAMGCKGKASTKWKPCPCTRYVIVIEPTERISLHKAFTETSYGTAISAYFGPEQTRAISVLPSRYQDVVILHNPDIDAVDRLIGDLVVNAEKGQILLQGYLRQYGGNTCQGVIVVPTVLACRHLVEIRKFGTFNKACITFAIKEQFLYVDYDNMVVPPRNYYKTIPACSQCGAVGYRATACPNLQPNTCGFCGLYAPLVEGCCLCCGANATNSRDCAAKFCTPKMAARKGWKKKVAPKDSRHPGLPSEQPRREPSRTDKLAPPRGSAGNRLSTTSPRQGGPEKRMVEVRASTAAWVTAVGNGHQGSNSGGAAFSSPLLTPLARATEQAEIAVLRTQN